MSDLVDTLKQFNDNISNFKNFMQHPFLNTGKYLLTCLVSGSKPVCLTGATISIILYIFGFKEAGKYIGLFCLLYFLIQCIGLVL